MGSFVEEMYSLIVTVGRIKVRLDAIDLFGHVDKASERFVYCSNGFNPVQMDCCYYFSCIHLVTLAPFENYTNLYNEVGIILEVSILWTFWV